jgi:RNA-directed DNA polymerase
VCVLSLNDLAWRLKTPFPELYELAEQVDAHYSVWPFVHKRTKVVRMIRSPSERLKRVQKLIAKQVLSQLDVSSHAHGGIKQRSTRTNASAHLAQRCVVNLDVRQFYPSIDHHRVYKLLVKQLGFGRDVAALITRLVTHRGQLVQGAPTSALLANLLLRAPVDEPVSAEAARRGLVYTRYLDDIAVSGDDPRPLINTVGKALSRVGLRMHRHKPRSRAKSKFRISRRSERQEVTGLVVNGHKAPTISKQKRSEIRAAINQIRHLDNEKEREKAIKSVQGRITHVRQFHPRDADRLFEYLTRVLN